MAENIAIDSTEPQDVGIARRGLPWEEVEGYVRIAHRPVLGRPTEGDAHRGVYWDGTAMRATGDLAADQAEALREFRAFLREA